MRWALLFLLVCGCSSLSSRSPDPYYGGSLVGSGTYQVETRVNPRSGAPYRFGMIFQKKENFVVVSALSSEGHTVFHARDSLRPGEEPELRFPPSELAAKKDDITLLYRALHLVLILNDKPSRHDPAVLERYGDQRPRTLRVNEILHPQIEEYDWAGHVRRIALTAPSFSAEMVFSEYQPEPTDD